MGAERIEPMDAAPRQLSTLSTPFRRAWWALLRKLPRLIWLDDEVNVVVTFTSDRLLPGDTVDEAFRSLFTGRLAQVEHALSDMGVGFDKGMGMDGRDWEWDWSLRGPISVRFRGRTKQADATKRLRALSQKESSNA